MILRGLAFFISRIFDFYFWFPVLLFIAIFNTGLTNHQIRILLPILLGLNVILPIFLFFLVLAKGKVSDIDVTKRQERHQLIGTLSIILVISSLISFYLGNNLFFVLQLTALAMTLTIFLVTLRFKISGHALMNTGAVFVVNYLFEYRLLWLFLVVPLIGFARIYLKKHSLIEVLTGVAVGLVEPYLILKFFKLL